MSEHKWIAKYRNCSFRGRHGKKGGSQFPRHQMNSFEGTHLGMRQRNKKEWHNHGGAALHSKYIIGLLNKFVGKSYYDFKQKFDNRLKNLKKYNLEWCRLEDYLFYDEIKEAYCWKQKFYVDKNNIIRKCKKLSYRNRIYPTLDRKQKRFNERVKLPNLGICISDSRYSHKKDNWGNYINDTYLHHTKTNPILLGTFWVVVNQKVLKLPLYTCSSYYYREYFNYKESHYDYSKHKYVTVPYEKYKSSLERSDYEHKKRAHLAENWIPVNSFISRKLNGQDYWITTTNPEVIKTKERIQDLNEHLEKYPESDYVNDWKEQLTLCNKTLETLSPKARINMGYGKFYLFVKRSDFKRQTENMV